MVVLNSLTSCECFKFTNQGHEHVLNHLLQLRVRARTHEYLTKTGNRFSGIAVAVAAAAAAAASTITNYKFVIISMPESFNAALDLLFCATPPPNCIPAPFFCKCETISDLKSKSHT
jgi:hypothetical protein